MTLDGGGRGAVVVMVIGAEIVGQEAVVVVGTAPDGCGTRRVQRAHPV